MLQCEWLHSLLFSQHTCCTEIMQCFLALKKWAGSVRVSPGAIRGWFLHCTSLQRLYLGSGVLDHTILRERAAITSRVCRSQLFKNVLAFHE